MAAEEAAELPKREAEERERRWHVLIGRAKERLVREQQAQQLCEQAEAWERHSRYAATATRPRPHTVSARTQPPGFPGRGLTPQKLTR
jgi:hypothetical protein